MSLNNMGLGMQIQAEDRASGAIRGVDGSLGRLRRAAGLAGTALAAAISIQGTRQILGGVKDLASAAGDFEFGIAKVGNIAQATEAELEQLSARAIQAGIDTQFSPTEASTGLEALASQGFKVGETMEYLGPSLDLAAGGMLGVEQAADTTAAALRVFPDEISNIGDVADKLLGISLTTSLAADDLSRGIGTVSRGAGLTKQSLDEMLISMGLVKNTGVEVSVSASSVSAALIQMGSKAKELKKIGVEVTDASGEFRDFLDVVVDFSEAADGKYTNAAKRAAATTKIFGEFGTTAVVAVQEQLQTLVDTVPGIDNMTEAVAYLRTNLQEAADSDLAKKFRESLQNTYAGQVTLMKGSLETLAITVGKPLADALRPGIERFTALLNRAIGFVQTMDPLLKASIARFVTVGGVILVAATAIGVLVAGLAFVLPLLAAGLKLLLGLAPVALIAGGAIYGFTRVVQRNLGGVGTFFSETWRKVSLFFRGIVGIIREGGFSGALRHELNEAGNSGIKKFVIDVAAVGFRIVRFFQGIKAGVDFMLEIIAPVFERLTAAFSALGDALGFAASSGADAMAGMPSSEYFGAGAKVGMFLARVLGVVVDMISTLVRYWAGLVEGVSSTVQRFSGVFTELREAIGSLIDEVSGGVGDVSDGLGGAQDGVQQFGKGVGTTVALVVTGLAKVITVLANFTTGVIRVWRSVKDVIGTIVDGITWAVEGVVGLLDRAVGVTGELDSNVKSMTGGAEEPEEESSFFDYMPALASYRAISGLFGDDEPEVAPERPPQRATSATVAVPASEQMAALQKMLQTFSTQAPDKQTVVNATVKLELDGEQLAEKVVRATEKSAARRGFTTGPAVR